ncbi:unnamed protein product [Camellia sinensis]
MSARYLRKVLRQQESQEQQQEDHQLDNDDDSESPDSSTPAFVNPFDLLNDDDHDRDQGSEPEIADEHEPLIGNIDDREPSVKATVNTVPSSNHKAKKKKKKKNKVDPSSSMGNIEKPLDFETGTTLASLGWVFVNGTFGNKRWLYVHSSSYSQVQSAYDAAKATHDLNGIASILFYHPYHLDSLITMAEYFKFSGDQQMAADSIAKCLYALECAWHPMFSPFQGTCQLKYIGHESNRPLFTALFTHMNDMHRRGCHRSALEICKLLLSVDSDDRKGAMQCIDYFSLRAEEYKWLEQFSEEYRTDNSIWLIPNFSFSLAICRFYLEHEEGSNNTQMKPGKATSTDLLKQALLLHPPVLKKLVAKVPLKDQAWTKILKHSYFGSDQTGIPTVDHLINIYVERSYLIWRLPDLQKLLRNSALLAIDTLERNKCEAQDWACVRKEAFPSDKNEYSHLLVSDFSDSVPTMPPDNLQNFLVDPRMREVPNGDQVANPPHGGGAPRNIANRNALAVLFESMLPWVDYGVGDGVGEDGQHNDHVQDHEN